MELHIFWIDDNSTHFVILVNGQGSLIQKIGSFDGCVKYISCPVRQLLVCFDDILIPMHIHDYYYNKARYFRCCWYDFLVNDVNKGGFIPLNANIIIAIKDLISAVAILSLNHSRNAFGEILFHISSISDLLANFSVDVAHNDNDRCYLC
jgi:hypothetical protein